MADRSFHLADRLALRPREAAKALGLSERALRQLAPEIPRVHRGGLVLYPVAELNAWLSREARASGIELDSAVKEELDALSGGS